jgi:hypothetical protein
LAATSRLAWAAVARVSSSSSYSLTELLSSPTRPMSFSARFLVTGSPEGGERGHLAYEGAALLVHEVVQGVGYDLAVLLPIDERHGRRPRLLGRNPPARRGGGRLSDPRDEGKQLLDLAGVAAVQEVHPAGVPQGYRPGPAERPRYDAPYGLPVVAVALEGELVFEVLECLGLHGERGLAAAEGLDLEAPARHTRKVCDRCRGCGGEKEREKKLGRLGPGGRPRGSAGPSAYSCWWRRERGFARPLWAATSESSSMAG